MSVWVAFWNTFMSIGRKKNINTKRERENQVYNVANLLCIGNYKPNTKCWHASYSLNNPSTITSVKEEKKKHPQQEIHHQTINVCFFFGIVFVSSSDTVTINIIPRVRGLYDNSFFDIQHFVSCGCVHLIDIQIQNVWMSLFLRSIFVFFALRFLSHLIHSHLSHIVRIKSSVWHLIRKLALITHLIFVCFFYDWHQSGCYEGFCFLFLDSLHMMIT